MRVVHIMNVEDTRCPYCAQETSSDAEWIDAARRAWGWCGFAVEHDQRRLAVLLLAPDAARQRALMTTIWVDAAHARHGLGRRLIQAASADLVNCGVSTLAARSTWPPTCAAPYQGFLRGCGFAYVAATGVWELAMRTTVVERPTTHGLVERIVASLRPIGPPEPAARATRTRPISS